MIKNNRFFISLLNNFIKQQVIKTSRTRIKEFLFFKLSFFDFCFMKRYHLFEFADLKWFPSIFRKCLMDLLRDFIEITGVYRPVVPFLKNFLQETNQNKIIDMASGGGGALVHLENDLNEKCLYTKAPVSIVLSDIYPQIESWKWIKNHYPNIDFISKPIDITNPPTKEELEKLKGEGLHTLFSCLHHLKENQVHKLLNKTTQNNQTIVIFEGASKRWIEVLAAIFLLPIGVFARALFVRPLCFWRVLFTYLIPILPFLMAWDGTVSILRLYPEKNWKNWTVSYPNFEWQTGVIPSRFGLEVRYLFGKPKQNILQNDSSVYY